jgi:hypothetical protein
LDQEEAEIQETIKEMEGNRGEGVGEWKDFEDGNEGCEGEEGYAA